MYFASIVKKAREEAGLSQHQVALKFKYSTSQFISNWERGISYPPVSQLKALANLYSLEADYLFEVLLEDKLYDLQSSLKAQYKKSK